MNRTALRARVSVLDPIRESPYGPAAFVKPHQEAEHTSVPDHMLPGVQISLASTGASMCGYARFCKDFVLRFGQ